MTVSARSGRRIRAVVAAMIFAIVVSTSSSADAGVYGVIATIPISGAPFSVALDASAHTAYVTSIDGGVSVIDETTDAVTHVVDAGKHPIDVAIDRSLHTAYVTTVPENAVSVIDETTNTVTTTIPVRAHPRGMAVDPNSHNVYVATPGNVAVIDGVTNTVTHYIPIGSDPFDVAVDPATHTVLVSEFGDPSITVIDENSNRVTHTIPLHDFPTGLAFDLSTNVAYAAVPNDNKVLMIDTTRARVLRRLTVKCPDNVAANSRNRTLYVSQLCNSSIAVIDDTKAVITHIIRVGISPEGLAADPLTRRVYATNAGSETVSVVYVPARPAITGLSSTGGSSTGGQTVTVTGTNFTSASQLYFGSGRPATTFHVDSDTQITATSPAHSPGTVQVRVVRPGGISATTTADLYTYG